MKSMQNPAWAEKRRVYNRESQTLRRRDAGASVRAVGPENGGSYGAGRLEAEEQLAWYAASGFRQLFRDLGWTYQELADRIGVDWKTIARIASESREVSEDVADRIAVGLGHPLTTIAPEGPVRYTARHNGDGRRK